MNMHRRWTQTHITELPLQLQQGHPIAAIAEQIDRDPEEVSSMMRRLRLRSTPVVPS
jgi:hypothetical protein